METTLILKIDATHGGTDIHQCQVSRRWIILQEIDRFMSWIWIREPEGCVGLSINRLLDIGIFKPSVHLLSWYIIMHLMQMLY